MAGLKERQKEGRQKSFECAANGMILELGFENSTIEGIAHAAGGSGVTVHNYYGTKAGILLTLVVEDVLQRIQNDLEALFAVQSIETA